MIRKWGLLTFKPTEQNRSWTRRLFAFTPLIRYLLRPPMTTCTTNDKITSCVTHSLKRAISHQWEWSRPWSQGEYLSCYGDLIMRLKPQWTLFLVGVVKGDGHSCFGDPSQTIFVHQILEISGTNLQGLTNQNKQHYILAFKLCNPLCIHIRLKTSILIKVLCIHYFFAWCCCYTSDL